MATLKGTFIYYKTANGHFNFRLKAPNKETIGVCEGAYESLTGCKSGINSVKSHSVLQPPLPIEDQTLVRGTEELKFPKFVVYKDKQGKFRYRMFAKNGNLICISEEGYASKESCKAGIESLRKWAPEADIVSEKDFK